MTMLVPHDETEAAALVQEAAARGDKLRIQGNGTRSSLVAQGTYDGVISAAAMAGVTLYEPAEMIIGAYAGTPVSVIEERLAQHGQALTFEPMDHRTLLGTEGEPTLGGLVAANVSGPKRILAGAARDNVVGVRFVNGRGEVIKNGGRVMKNVTGLDLVRLMCGSWGTLGLMTEITLKVLPKAPDALTLAWPSLADGRAIALLCQAMGTPFEVNGAAHLPGQGAAASTVIRLEGFPEQLDYRAGELAKILAEYGSPTRVSGDEHDVIWRAVRDVQALAEPVDRAIWKLSVPADQGAAVVAAIRAERAAEVIYDWSGGLVWLAADAADGDAGAAVIRRQAAAVGGHATLVRGSAELAARVPVFTPEPAPLKKLSQGIKQSFDPKGVFNAGVMAA